MLRRLALRIVEERVGITVRVLDGAEPIASTVAVPPVLLADVEPEIVFSSTDRFGCFGF